MTPQKLDKIKQRIEEMRLQAGNIKGTDLIKLAESLGRLQRSGGKHLIYKNYYFKELRPVAITGHPVPLGKGLVLRILNDLELDIERWEKELN